MLNVERKLISNSDIKIFKQFYLYIIYSNNVVHDILLEYI